MYFSLCVHFHNSRIFFHLPIYIYIYIYACDYIYIYIYICVCVCVWVCLLYNDCWHRFMGLFLVTRVLWQAVTLWLVNRGDPKCVGVGQSSSCVTERETTWYENHEVRLRVQSESIVEPGIRSWSGALGHLWRYGLQAGASVSTPWLQVEDMGQEEVPSLSICLSIYISNFQQTVCPFENKMRVIYFFIKNCVSSVHWSSFIIFDYVLDWVYGKYTIYMYNRVCMSVLCSSQIFV